MVGSILSGINKMSKNVLDKNNFKKDINFNLIHNVATNKSKNLKQIQEEDD